METQNNAMEKVKRMLRRIGGGNAGWSTAEKDVLESRARVMGFYRAISNRAI